MLMCVHSWFIYTVSILVSVGKVIVSVIADVGSVKLQLCHGDWRWPCATERGQFSHQDSSAEKRKIAHQNTFTLYVFVQM